MKINISGIHPPDLVKKENALIEKERLDYLDQKGNFKYGKNSACPICQGKKLSALFFKNGFHFQKCSKCNLVFANPRPSDAFLKRYYTEGASYEFMQNTILQKTAKFRNEIILKPKLEIVNSFSKTKGKILDIGCASGFFLSLAQKSNWECYGLEPSQEGIKFLKKNFPFITAFQTTIEEVSITKKFHAITCWEMAEHILRPMDLFKKTYSLLAENGLLFLSVPNSEGLDMLVLKELSDAFSAPSHLNYFNPKSISFALQKAGFKDIKIITPGIFDLDKIINAIKYKKSEGLMDNFLLRLYEDKEPRSFEKFKNEFAALLQKNNWSGHMIAIAAKNKF